MAVKKSSSYGLLKRRDFLALATSSVALVAGPWPFSRELKAFPGMPVEGARVPTPVGIVPEALNAARKRAAEIVGRLTLAEKIPQFSAAAPAVPRINLPAYRYYASEALHGLIRNGPITSFPLPLAMGCSWNRSLIERVFTAASDEIWAWHKKDGQGLAMFSPPTVNMGTRDPRWGRIGENYSEDPCLVRELAVKTIQGMQGSDPQRLKTIACAKHFIVNETEGDREVTSATVDPRSFWEYYSRGFEACVRDGHVFTVMSSYNSMNGIPTSASRFLLTDLLRKRWGFQGYVVSDCDAIGDIFNPHHFVGNYAEASALAIHAGSSINCGDTLEKHLGEAVDQMLISEEALDKALIRAFTGRVLLGDFDPIEQSPYNVIPIDCLESTAHRELAREAARQSIVLFKNKNNTLPLDKRRIKKLAVIGPMAADCHLGDYSGLPTSRISPLRGIKEYLGIAMPPSYRMRASEVVENEGTQHLKDCNEGGIYHAYAVNNGWSSYPKMRFDGATDFHARVATLTAGGSVEVHLDSRTGPVVATLKISNTGGWLAWTNISAPLAPVTGDHELHLKFLGGTGRLFNLQSFWLTPEKPVEDQSRDGVTVTYAMGCTVLGEKDPARFDEAVKIAHDADVALVFVGGDNLVSTEELDRSAIGLPGVQHELVQAVFAANPRTVLMIKSCCPLAVNWEQENLPAIVGGLFLGQEQGPALAEVLFGDYNPGGKLSTTWYRRVEDLPDFHDYNIRNGRTYMYFRGIPLYPFGHGLSYTTFRYKNLSISGPALKPGGKLTVSLDVTNTGNREGDEIVQLYVRFPEARIELPKKQLADFDRVHLKAGETKTVSFDLAYGNQALQYWDEAKYAFITDPGPLELMVGASSADIRLRQAVEIAGEKTTA